ncbi:hypothetical protein [Acidovorax sp. SUPP2825]|uniref:hypothetical protein n=1 Tax=Acidovorax sp. SUPP2825 TaxID=2920879 RepID=UPI0023DE326D|nr:hypothetical protein [Acidovorax sp. SUPP2825]GKS93335.1 hypothetical protein AVAK2825_02390 [Acidovorax sp. SUPP2825]
MRTNPEVTPGPNSFLIIDGLLSWPMFTIPPEPGQAPTPEDLAETSEVTLTVAVRAKAQDLGNNPVAIQNWVRNTIQWVPIWDKHRYRAHPERQLGQEQLRQEVGGIQPAPGPIHECAGTCGAQAVLQ